MVDRAYNDLVEQVANLDDEVGTLFLEEKPVTAKRSEGGNPPVDHRKSIYSGRRRFCI